MTRYDSRPSARQRGYTTRWQKARASYLLSHPLCTMCKKAGRITPATVVDHIKAHKGDQALFWDQANWQALCAMHHNSDKQRIDQGKDPQPTIGIDGWPII